MVLGSDSITLSMQSFSVVDGPNHLLGCLSFRIISVNSGIEMTVMEHNVLYMYRLTIIGDVQ